jgi:hypothetical protein
VPNCLNEKRQRLTILVSVQCQWDGPPCRILRRVWSPSLHELQCPQADQIKENISNRHNFLLQNDPNHTRLRLLIRHITLTRKIAKLSSSHFPIIASSIIDLPRASFTTLIRDIRAEYHDNPSPIFIRPLIPKLAPFPCPSFKSLQFSTVSSAILIWDWIRYPVSSMSLHTHIMY